MSKSKPKCPTCRVPLVKTGPAFKCMKCMKRIRVR